MVNYPTSLDNDTTLYLVVDNVDDYLAVHHNALKDGLIAVQTAVGITGAFNFELSGVVATHAALTTGVHGVGGSTVAALTDLHTESHTMASHSDDDSYDIVTTGDIDLNPIGPGDIFSLTPTITLPGSSAWRAMHVDGSSLDPTGSGCEIGGLKIHFSGILMTNNPDLWGLHVTMPVAYGSGTEYAGRFEGDGRIVEICNDSYAINVSAGATLLQIAADDATYTGLVTSDSGVLKYRTKAQVLDDIGAAASESRTRWLTVMGSAFMATNDSPASWWREVVDGSLRIVDSAGNMDYLIAPCVLPHGAVVTQCDAYGYENAGTGTLTVILYRSPMDGVVEQLIFEVVINSTTPQIFTTTTIYNATIDNENYAYYFRLQYQSNNAGQGQLQDLQVYYTETGLA